MMSCLLGQAFEIASNMKVDESALVNVFAKNMLSHGANPSLNMDMFPSAWPDGGREKKVAYASQRHSPLAGHSPPCMVSKSSRGGRQAMQISRRYRLRLRQLARLSSLYCPRAQRSWSPITKLGWGWAWCRHMWMAGSGVSWMVGLIPRAGSNKAGAFSSLKLWRMTS